MTEAQLKYMESVLGIRTFQAMSVEPPAPVATAQNAAASQNSILFVAETAGARLAAAEEELLIRLVEALKLSHQHRVLVMSADQNQDQAQESDAFWKANLETDIVFLGSKAATKILGESIAEGTTLGRNARRIRVTYALHELHSDPKLKKSTWTLLNS